MCPKTKTKKENTLISHASTRPKQKSKIISNQRVNASKKQNKTKKESTLISTRPKTKTKKTKKPYINAPSYHQYHQTHFEDFNFPS